jgi:hypothetical protein
LRQVNAGRTGEVYLILAMDTSAYRRIALSLGFTAACAAASAAQQPPATPPPAPAPAPAPAAKPAEPLKITPFGIAYFNLFSNTDPTNNADVPLFVTPAAGPGNTSATARQSRLGLRVTGATVGRAKVSGVIEADFFGGYPAVGIGDNMGVLRLRLANARLDWTKGSLVVGQDWMVFAPVNPLSLSSAGIPLFAAGGNPWARLPQVRGEWKTKTVLLQGAVLAPQTGDFNSAFFYVPGSGALSETPFLQGRAAATLANFAASKKVATIGVSGHWGQSRVIAGGFDRKVDSNGIAGDWVLPLGTKVTVQGELFTGSNIGGFQAGIFQGLIADGAVAGPGGTPVLDGPRGISTTGGWVQALVTPTPSVTAHVGFGFDDPDDEDFLTVIRRESRIENTAISVGFQHKVSAQITLGLEYRHLETKYLIAGDKTNGHVNAAFTFTF